MFYSFSYPKKEQISTERSAHATSSWLTIEKWTNENWQSKFEHYYLGPSFTIKIAFVYNIRAWRERAGIADGNREQDACEPALQFRHMLLLLNLITLGSPTDATESAHALDF